VLATCVNTGIQSLNGMMLEQRHHVNDLDSLAPCTAAFSMQSDVNMSSQLGWMSQTAELKVRATTSVASGCKNNKSRYFSQHTADWDAPDA
jgi:hypothetical protein